MFLPVGQSEARLAGLAHEAKLSPRFESAILNFLRYCHVFILLVCFVYIWLSTMRLSRAAYMCFDLVSFFVCTVMHCLLICLSAIIFWFVGVHLFVDLLVYN